MWNRQIAVVEYKLKEYIISNGIKELELCMYDDKVYRIEKSKSTLLLCGLCGCSTKVNNDFYYRNICICTRS